MYERCLDNDVVSLDAGSLARLLHGALVRKFWGVGDEEILGKPSEREWMRAWALCCKAVAAVADSFRPSATNLQDLRVYFSAVQYITVDYRTSYL